MANIKDKPSIYTRLFKGLGMNVAKSYTETTSRPAIMQPYMPTDTGAKLPVFPFPLIMIYELARNADSLRIPIETINRETFKNGFEIVEKWKYKCPNCSKEFEFKPIKDEDDTDSPESPQKEPQRQLNTPQKSLRKLRKQKEILECDECGSRKLLRPVPEHRRLLEKLYTQAVNNNEQTFEDVARQLEFDLEIADNAYLLILKNYNINDATGEINWEDTRFKEILRIDPPQVALIIDSDGRLGYDDKRIPVFVCPHFEHRDKRLTTPYCPRHHVPVQALKAIAEVSSVYSVGIPQPKRVIYGEGEIIWKPGKYQPSLTYGFSPIFAIWSKVMSLVHMDEYIRKYFDKMRPPRGLLVVASRNYESFQKSWHTLEERAIEDPYRIHPLMVESEKGGRNMAQWIDFTGSLRELQFTDIRSELRMIIGAMYGVLPLYYGEMPGGWNQEGLQVTITNRMVKWSQDILKKAFFDKLAHMMGIDDWNLQLKAGEEADELRDLQIQAQEIENHRAIQTMGFAVERTHSGEWKVAKKPDFSQMPMAGGGRGPSTTGSSDITPARQGSPMSQTPSRPGGTGQGSPTAGGKRGQSFNQNQKSKADASMKPPEKPEDVETITKPVREHSWDYWKKELQSQGYDDESANRIIGSWEAEEKSNPRDLEGSKALYMPTQVENDDEKLPNKKPKAKKKRGRPRKKHTVKQLDTGETEIISEDIE